MKRTITQHGITYRQENHFFFEPVDECRSSRTDIPTWRDEYHPLYGWILIGLALLTWAGLIWLGWSVYRAFEALAS